MIKINKTEIYNWENAIRGMRHPLESYEKSDSKYNDMDCMIFEIGENDLNLMKRLIKAGSDHRKFLRQILVSMDITAPLYWWKEMDTYKVGTVANSTSSMHTIHKNGIDYNVFSIEDVKSLLPHDKINIVNSYIYLLEELRCKYNETKDKSYWRMLIQLLPSSLNQTRMMTMNYEVILNIYNSRKNHKLKEWIEFCKWIETLPYAKELIVNVKN